MPSNKIRRLLSAENAFLAMGLVCGLLFVFVTPPFQVPDEPQHFYQAFRVSELRFFDTAFLPAKEKSATGVGWSGALLPKSLAALVTSSDLVTTRFRPYSKLIPSKVFGAQKIPLNPDQREYLPVAPYPPAGYIPQAIGIAIGRVFGLPPLFLFYLGRLGSLAGWLALTFLAIRNTPVLKWAYLLLALMPMTLFLAASNSVDSFVIGLSFLFSATLLKWAYDDTKTSVRGSDLACLALMALGIAWSKAIYLVLVFLFLLIPLHKFKNRREYYRSLAAVIAIAVAAYCVWGFVIDRTTGRGPTIGLSQHAVDPTPFSNTSPAKQAEFIYANPVAFVGVLAKTADVSGVFILYSFFGFLGWLDTLLPLWLPFAYVPALIAASWLNGSPQRITAGARLFSASIFVVTMLVSLLVLYTRVNSVGADMILGYQGRYLIPVAPAFFFLFHRNQKSIRPNLMAILLMLFVAMTTAIAAYRVSGRFYSGNGVAYHIDDVSMSPDRDAVVVTGWAVDRNTGDPARGLDLKIEVFPAVAVKAPTLGELANGLDVKIDGRNYPARYGLDRPDVAEDTGELSYRYAGFEAKIPASELSPGSERLLALRIRTQDGKSYILRDPKLTLNSRVYE